MTHPNWSWCVAPGIARTTTLAVDINSFGDGYVHRSTRGLNPARPSWTISVPFPDLPALTAMDSFLQSFAAQGFYWTPPDSTDELFVTCDHWAATIVDRGPMLGAMMGTLSATFVRAFNPQQAS
jgi:phage-related protein